MSTRINELREGLEKAYDLDNEGNPLGAAQAILESQRETVDVLLSEVTEDEDDKWLEHLENLGYCGGCGKDHDVWECPKHRI